MRPDRGGRLSALSISQERALAPCLRQTSGGKRRRPPVEAVTDLDDDPAAQSMRKAGELIAPPRWLTPFGTAMTLWKREAVPIIQQLRFIRPSDHHALARW